MGSLHSPGEQAIAARAARDAKKLTGFVTSRTQMCVNE
jgi:hypothetical protein